MLTQAASKGMMLKMAKTKALTTEGAEELIGRIPAIPAFEAAGGRERIAMYRQALAKKDPVQWIKVIKSSYLMKGKELSSQTEKTLELSYREKAYGLLHGLLAEALKIDEGDVEDYIKGRIA